MKFRGSTVEHVMFENMRNEDILAAYGTCF
jgi:hypothetical protein